MERLRPQIERQVEHGLRSLSEEFEAEVAPDEIWRSGRQRLRAIRVPARFDDFVPVLVYAACGKESSTGFDIPNRRPWPADSEGATPCLLRVRR